MGVTLDAMFALCFLWLIKRGGGTRAQIVAALSVWIFVFQLTHVVKLSALGVPAFFGDLSALGVLMSVSAPLHVALLVASIVLLLLLLAFGLWPASRKQMLWPLAALSMPFALYMLAPWQGRLVDALFPSLPGDYTTHLQHRGGVQFLLDQHARRQALAARQGDLLQRRDAAYAPRLSHRRNVHLVLLETFWDPHAFGAFEFSRDPFDPRFRALLDEGGSSGVLTPHFGHLTANAEFEVLCGLPAAHVAVFQSRMTGSLPCLPRLLRELGYQTLASHSNHADSWGRDRAYGWMGFAHFNAYDSFVRDDLDGVFLNDGSFYRQNREAIAGLSPGAPYFNYLVTISSHYPYRQNPERRPALVATTPTNAAVEDYANAIAYSSAAFMDWLADVRRTDPDALIVAFGDHAPTMPPDQRPYSQSGIKIHARPFEDAHTLLSMSRTPLLFIDGRKGAVNVGTVSLEYLPVLITRALGIQPEGLPYLTDDMESARAARSARFLGNVITLTDEGWVICGPQEGESQACLEATELYDQKRSLRDALLARPLQTLELLGLEALAQPTEMNIDAPNGCLIDVQDWGPKSAVAGDHFNRQTGSGLSATWLRVARVQGKPRLQIGVMSAKVEGAGDVLAAVWPAPSVIKDAGEYPVRVLCGETEVATLGTMTVAAPSLNGGADSSSHGEAFEDVGRTVTGPLSVQPEDAGSLQVSASALSGVCRGDKMEAAVVEMHWQHPEGEHGIRVMVQQGRETPKLWSESGPQGTSITGPWVNEDVRFIFTNSTGHKLGAVKLMAPGCG
ncbi:LTA synthase family protein [Luteimonas sp. RC10]|uniref:LTA synthase family protein n=1 Tax=Luteimonas sp. RC10 TaxID=2587035 RepID=UPI00160807D5|nr:LTA synthase family protein [Luteimonas sp. RC10]MBB3345219.1 hypothetical protein [Luteimonas sp. RC10]